MKPIEQLQEILCTVESVEKDVKELRFGCEFSALGAKQRFTELDQGCIYINKGGELVYDTDEYGEVHCKIIGNPLSLKHLMMYSQEQGIRIAITCKGIQWISRGFLQEEIEYNHKLELYEQEDKVLLEIFNFFKG